MRVRSCNRIHADEERICNFTVVTTLSNKPDDFEFPTGQPQTVGPSRCRDDVSLESFDQLHKDVSIARANR